MGDSYDRHDRSTRDRPRYRIGARRDQFGNLLPTPRYNPTTDANGVTRTSGATTASVMMNPDSTNLSAGHDWSGFERTFAKPTMAAPLATPIAPPQSSVTPAAVNPPDAAGESGAGRFHSIAGDVRAPEVIDSQVQPRQTTMPAPTPQQAANAAVANSRVGNVNGADARQDSAIIASPPPVANGLDAHGQPQANQTGGPIDYNAIHARRAMIDGDPYAAPRAQAVNMTSEGEAVHAAGRGDDGAAPFRGSTPDEVREFFQTDPNRADNNARLQQAGQLGGQYRTPYGTVGAAPTPDPVAVIDGYINAQPHAMTKPGGDLWGRSALDANEQPMGTPQSPVPQSPPAVAPIAQPKPADTYAAPSVGGRFEGYNQVVGALRGAGKGDSMQGARDLGNLLPMAGEQPAPKAVAMPGTAPAQTDPYERPLDEETRRRQSAGI